MIRLREGIKDLLFGGQKVRVVTPATAPAGNRSHAPVPARPPQPTKAEDPARQLRSLFAQKETISAGRLQIVGLQKIRSKLGDRWASLHEKVERIAERTIRRRLGPWDSLWPHGDLGFILIFGQTPEAEAEAKCALIAEEIWTEVFGEGISADEIEVKSAVVRVDGQVSVKDVNQLRLALVRVAGIQPGFRANFKRGRGDYAGWPKASTR